MRSSFSACSLRVIELCDDNEGYIFSVCLLLETHFFYFLERKFLMKKILILLFASIALLFLTIAFYQPLILWVGFLIIVTFVSIFIIDSRRTKKIRTKYSNISYNQNNQQRVFSEQRQKICRYCGSEIHNNAVICVKCGCPTPEYQRQQQLQQKKYDTNSRGLNVLSFMFPLVGFILHFVFKEEKPVRALGCLKWALISFFINVVIFIIYVANM